MVGLLVNLLILLLVAGLIYWVITLIPLPPPFHTIALAVFGVILVIILIYWLLPLAGGPPAGHMPVR